MSGEREQATTMIEQLVHERTGLTRSRANASTREHLLRLAMAREGVKDAMEYLALLEREPSAFEELVSDLTVPESYFFRQPEDFALLRRHVLPALLNARGERDELALWSAGCAAGEEAYSLAILLEQELLAARSQVLGTDISARALARAERAEYSRWALRATAPRDVERYFSAHGREYRLVPRLRKRVRFQHHSLTARWYPRGSAAGRGFDLILCRNVLIYFDAATTRAVGERLAQSLEPLGWLFLGPSDPLLEIDSWCEISPTPHGVLYQRRAEEGRARAPRGTEVQAPSTEVATPKLHEATASPRQEPSTAATRTEPRPYGEPSADDALGSILEIARDHGFAAAETGCRDELRAHPLFAPLYLIHGKLLLELGREAEAEIALRRALYLDRTLLVAQMLSATLAERRGDRVAAQRGYLQLASECSAGTPEELVPYGDGLTYDALRAIAALRARALDGKARG